MEKFKKLNRNEMRNIQGGQPLCNGGQIVVCNCDGSVLCVIVPDGEEETPNAACIEAGCQSSALNPCFDDCPLQ